MQKERQGVTVQVYTQTTTSFLLCVCVRGEGGTRELEGYTATLQTQV